jgi:RNA polymerase sigma-70 factor (ECF subfamily)
VSEASDLEQHRGALTRHCRRMLGSGSDADDAVQETMLRAWRSRDHFEARSTVSTWMYRIATNVCLDLLRNRRRHGPSIDLGSASLDEAPTVALAAASSEHDPADVSARRDAVRMAFVAALTHLPARQRAVVILRDVLSWPARDVADLLDTTVASVNSALQRGRAALAGRDRERLPVLDLDQRTRLAGYVDAFGRDDFHRLVWLLLDELGRQPANGATSSSRRATVTSGKPTTLLTLPRMWSTRTSPAPCRA